MKTIKSIFIAGLTMCLLFAFSPVLAQTDNTIVVVSKFKMTFPENGTFKERDSLMKVWHDNLVVKNSKILSARTYIHLYSDDSRDIIFETEYKSLTDMEAADKIQDELAKKLWPGENDRAPFTKLWGQYFGPHSDNMFTHIMKYKKN